MQITKLEADKLLYVPGEPGQVITTLRSLAPIDQEVAPAGFRLARRR